MKCEACGETITVGVESCPHCNESLCPECGALLPLTATVCGNCGTEYGLFCSNCEEEVPPDADVCPYCGESVAEVTASAPTQSGPALYLALPEEEATAIADAVACPRCAAEIYAADGFCTECGQMVCSHCGGAVDEDVDTCPHCNRALYITCALCDFELTAGTEMCPNCHALFPTYCAACGAKLSGGQRECPQCGVEALVAQRSTARIIHSLMTDTRLVRVVACPDCGESFELAAGVCRVCGYRICPSCQISLQADEKVCPRCGWGREVQDAEVVTCPRCGKYIPKGSEECLHCEQSLCPECNTAVAATDDSCPNCGVEFEFFCPGCNKHIRAADERCGSCGLRF